MKLRRVAALSATLLLVGATAASAAGPPYTVSVGGNATAGTEAITASSTGPVQMSWRNNAGTVVNMNCTSVHMSATVTRGTGVNPIASITSTTWTGCRIPGGAATVQQNGTWNLSGTGTNATTAASDSVGGFVGNLAARFFATANPAIFDFTLTGQADGRFDEATQQLVISETGYSGDLTAYVPNGVTFLGQMQNGNPFNLGMTLNVTSPNGAINLS